MLSLFTHIIFLFLTINNSEAYDSIGWFIVGNSCSEMTPDTFPYNYYSHIVVGNPIVSDNGTATCNKSDLITKRFVELAKLHNKKIIYQNGLPPDNVWHVLLNNSWSQYKSNYLSSIRDAVVECGIDGIEFDYECPNTTLGRAGIVSEYESTKYTEFLAAVKNAIGPDRQVGCDMGVWGVTRGSYPLMYRPWINVSMLKNGAFDYINTMSYHLNDNLLPWNHQSESIFPWEKDGYILTKLWKIPANKINIGIPYYFYNKTFNEVSWCDISKLCPDIDAKETNCQGIRIVSKKQNSKIGKYVKTHGFRGVFPWAANYDSLTNNNTLVKWVYDGYNSL